MPSDYLVVFVTAEERDGEKIAKVLLNKKLAACVNIVPKINSFFWWEGKIDNSEEVLLIIKTTKDRIESLMETVKREHSYSVPEIIALPILVGNNDYLMWMKESLEHK